MNTKTNSNYFINGNLSHITITTFLIDLLKKKKKQSFFEGLVTKNKQQQTTNKNGLRNR